MIEESLLQLAEEESAALDALIDLIRAFKSLCDWAVARRLAEKDAVRHLEAAKERAALALERVKKVRFSKFRVDANPIAKAIIVTTETSSLAAIARLFGSLSIPPFLIASNEQCGITLDAESKQINELVVEGPLVVRVMLTLDGRPWVNPQVLRSGTVYDLKAKIVAPMWPSTADRLVLDFITTLPPEHRRVQPIEILRSLAEVGAEVTWAGHIEFPVGQSILSEPALLQLRATFLAGSSETAGKTATIVGYHKLQVRVSDLTTTPLLSKYRALDQRIVSIVDEVRSMPGLNDGHFVDFIEMLGAILNYMGICAQQAIYRSGRQILESDFQRDLLVHLRGQLGEDVHEAPKQGGGITDIRYRTVVAELKVEVNLSNRADMLQSYQNQLTQYSGATGAQLGILCVLDTTEKTLPPAPPQNNVQLLTPKLHGFTENGHPPFPVRIAAVIIDGNIRKPSDYSR